MSLEHLVPLEYYMPTIYKDVKEMEAYIKSQDYLFDILISIVDKEYARMFIQTSDEIGVERFERILGIVADPTVENLDFRKQRLLTRCNSTLPYTTIWLRIYLNAVLGEQSYDLQIDYTNDIIKLYGYLLDYSWAKEVKQVINRTKPCNMIFINIPTMIENVGLAYWDDNNTWEDSIWDDDNIWSEFTYLQTTELGDYDKQLETSNIFQLIKQDIHKIRLNQSDVNIITDFTVIVQNDTINIKFTVPDDIKLVEFVEVLDKYGSPLVNTNCYIDSSLNTNIEIRLSCYKRKD